MISGPESGAETTRVHFVYDAWNRLVAVQADDGNGNAGVTLAEYKFDGLNRRIVIFPGQSSTEWALFHTDFTTN